jgi:DNA polymerase elongation subunit (family B)
MLVSHLEKENLKLNEDGTITKTTGIGVIPSILDEWFKKRVEYKDLMKKYAKEGNKEKEVYYDQLQAVQKVFLNSIYGVLGLSIFRFYDLDNAAAVTVSGQDIIKTTAKYISGEYKKAGVAPKDEWWLNEYKKILDEENDMSSNTTNEEVIPDDHCIYIDTDSVYFSAVPMIQASVEPVVSPKEFTINLARTTEAKVNKLYDVLAKILFNCDTHRFYIKGEAIMETAFWVKKKRYALKKIYDLEKNMDKDELVVKGMDVVRSSFPPAFQKFMKGILKDILDKKPKSLVDGKVLQFYKDIQTMPIVEIARNTSIKELSKYEDVKNNNLSWFPKGATAHAKACMTYNRLLRLWGKDKIHAPIKNGDKIKYVFLKEENPYRLESVAWKTYDDPEELMQLINEYVDHKHLFEAEMEKKLEKFYNALRWGLIPTKINQAASMFLD